MKFDFSGVLAELLVLVSAFVWNTLRLLILFLLGFFTVMIQKVPFCTLFVKITYTLIGYFFCGALDNHDLSVSVNVLLEPSKSIVDGIL
jgi:hypothetical protein